ncbi:unnamed protein product [Prunus armeniaca]
MYLPSSITFTPSDLSKLDKPAPLLALCQYVETKLNPANETIRIHMPEEVFGTDHDTWLLSEDILQFASMVEIGSTVIAVYIRSHWVLIIVRPARRLSMTWIHCQTALLTRT